MSAPRAQHAPHRGVAADDRPTRRAPRPAPHSIRIGRLLGIPLEVHWSFLLLVGFVVVVEWPAGAGAVVGGLVWVAALFAGVVIHEVAHCIVAQRRGGTVLGILLLPIGGMSRMDQIPERPADEAAIAAAGPATSLVLGALLLAAGALLGSSVWPPALVAGSWWARLGWLNLLLAAFNLLPALPMDGGRMLRAALARRLPRLAATRVAASVARVLAVGLVVAGVFYDFWLVLIGIFVLLGASGEESRAQADELAKRQPRGWDRWSGRGAPPGRDQSPSPPQESPPPWGPAGSAPQGPPGPPPWGPPGSPPQGHPWPPPWGQEPSSRSRSAIDVAVERSSPDASGGQPPGEGVGEGD